MRVAVARAGGRLRVRVTDDGRGFDPRNLPEGSLGLRGMRERAALAGGSLELVSHPGGGTTVTLEVPLA